MARTDGGQLSPAPQLAEMVPTGEHFDVVSTDGTRVRAWRNGGRGVPVIISNGLGTPPASWPALIRDSRRFRVATWYYRGTGGGERPADVSHVRIQDHVDDLIAVMDAEGMERAIVVGWSLGVNVMFEAACRHPDRIAALLPVAGVPGGTFRAMFGPIGVPRPLRHPLGVAAAHTMRLAAPLLNAAARRIPLNRTTATIINHTGFVLPAAEPDRLLAALEEFIHHDWKWYFTLALGATAHAPMDLSFVKVPTVLVAGRWDVLTSYRDMLDAASKMPHAEVRLLPGSHFLPLEYPDEIHRLLVQLVQQTEFAELLGE